jgi:hypothetical protein
MTLTSMPPEREPNASVCPACGAERITTAAVSCWLCEAMLPALSGPALGPIPSPRTGGPGEDSGSPLLAVLLIGLIGVVVVGAFLAAPGLGILMIVLMVPVLLAIWAPAPSSVLRDAVVAIATIIAAGVAGFVTFFAFCLWSFTRSNGGYDQAILGLGCVAAIVVPVLILLTLSRTLSHKK